MPQRSRTNAFVRRQSPPAGAAECIRICKLNHSTCKVANDCECSANDNDWLWGWVNQDRGPSIFDWWKADLVARCPLAFIHDRPPTATVTPKPQAPSTSESATIMSTSQTTSASSVSITSVVAVSVHSSESLTDSPAESTAGSLATEQAENSSQSSVTPAASQTIQFVTSLDAEQGQSLSESHSDTPSARAGQTLSSATSSVILSTGVPLLEPLDPSPPVHVNKVNVGVIAGLVIAVLAVLAIFLAFWYRSHRRKQRAKLYQFPSPMPTRHDEHDPSGSEAWAHYGGAKGSMISSPHEAECEKDAPISNMFSNRNGPLGPGMPSLDRRSPADRSYAQPLSTIAHQAAGGQLLPRSLDVDENAAKEDLAPYPPSLLPRKTPAESVCDDYIRSAKKRPESETALTYRSLPRDIPVFEEGGEGHDLKATSTRAPSLDLAWVTQGDSRTPIPSWAASRKQYSIRSKNSSKSPRNESIYRHSIMSTTSGPSIGPSRSTHTSSSRQSRSTQNSIGPVPDMPSYKSIPAFRFEIGADRAKAIMQLLVTSPVSSISSEKGVNAEP